MAEVTSCCSRGCWCCHGNLMTWPTSAMSSMRMMTYSKPYVCCVVHTGMIRIMMTSIGDSNGVSCVTNTFYFVLFSLFWQCGLFATVLYLVLHKQVPVPVHKVQVQVPVFQVPVQVPVLGMQWCKYKYKYQYPKIVLKYRSSNSTSTTRLVCKEVYSACKNNALENFVSFRDAVRPERHRMTCVRGTMP